MEMSLDSAGWMALKRRWAPPLQSATTSEVKFAGTLLSFLFNSHCPIIFLKPQRFMYLPRWNAAWKFSIYRYIGNAGESLSTCSTGDKMMARLEENVLIEEVKGLRSFAGTVSCWSFDHISVIENPSGSSWALWDLFGSVSYTPQYKQKVWQSVWELSCCKSFNISQWYGNY